MAFEFNKEKLNALADAKGISTAEVLRRAGVSRNAYYNLLRQGTLLPKSVEQIAETLGVGPEELVVLNDSDAAKMRRKMFFVEKLAKQHRKLDVGTALTTLKLLDLSPLERLELSIRYGKAAASF